MLNYPGVGVDRDASREWYNGYGWRGNERVCNPFDIPLLFDSREFDAWWFESGTPAFLVETLSKRKVSSVALGETTGSASLLSAFDVDRIVTEALLFQTGQDADENCLATCRTRSAAGTSWSSCPRTLTKITLPRAEHAIPW